MIEQESTRDARQRARALLVDLGAAAAMLAVATVGCRMAESEPEQLSAHLGSPSTKPAALAPVESRSEPVSGQATAGNTLQLLRRLVKLCSPDPESAAAHCPRHEDEELGKLLSQGKEIPPEDAIIGVHDALGSSDDKLRTVAAVVAERAFASGFGAQYPAPVRITAARFAELAKEFSALAPAQAVLVAPLLVHEGVLAGAEARTLELLRVSPAVELAGYRHLMVYGRIAQLPRLRSTAAKDPTLALEAAALMPNWSDSERATLCSWAAPQYRDKRPEVRGAAGRALAQCGIDTLGPLFAVANQQGQVGDWAPGQPLAFAKACATRQQVESNQAFCEDAKALLTSGVTFAKLASQTRVDSLEALMSSEVWVMDLEVSQLVRQNTKSADPALASAARQAATKLTSLARAGVAQMMQLPTANRAN